jgi:hypothetical protein
LPLEARRAAAISARGLCVALCGLALLFVSGAARPAAAGAPGPAVRVRIGVTRDGIVRVTPADLAALGLDPAGIVPGTFALSSAGQPVAIWVGGEHDGRFDPTDELRFFGQKFRGPEMDEKYTDERVYWLDIGGAAGRRVVDLAARPKNDLVPPASFPSTVRAERDEVWWTQLRLDPATRDTWFWARLRPVGVGGVAQRNLPSDIPDPAPGFPATLRLEVIPRTWSDSLVGDHRLTLALNNASVADWTWDGAARTIFTATAAANIIASGPNTATVAAFTVPGILVDDVYVNYWEIAYRRLFRAAAGQLDFRTEEAGPHEYLVGGWPTARVVIWDVTDPAWPRRLIEARAAPDGAEVALRFRADSVAQAHYWLQAEASLSRPASLNLRPPTGLRASDTGADAIIVTHGAFRTAAEQLATWHRDHGRRAIVADIQDVYDEFNDGVMHPKAVTAFLAWATEHWPAPAPAYVTLIGDGNWNPKGNNPAVYPPEPTFIPPYLAWADPWQGEVPADARYGDLDGDGVPDLAVGRLAVNSVTEAETVVAKLTGFDEGTRSQPWQQRALFVADNPDVAGDFPFLSDAIISAYLPADLRAERVYLGRSVPLTNVVGARELISVALQSGVGMVQYSGHGAPERWAGEQLWTTQDVPALRNGARLPVVLTFNCLDGYFAYPGRPSIAETMQRLSGGGAVAAISPSGLGTTPEQHAFREILMQTMFREGVRELGSALLLSNQRYAAEVARGVPELSYLIDTMMLYGDPALRLPRAVDENRVGVVALPLAGARRGPPGATVTHRLRALNTGATAEPFAIAVSSVWPVDLPAATGVLAADASEEILVRVHLPAGGRAGDRDVAGVVLTSLTDPRRSFTATLTTTIVPTYGVQITPQLDLRAGPAGGTVSFAVAVSNAGDVGDTFDMSADGRWPVTAAASVGPLAPGATELLTVAVAVPAGAETGAIDISSIVVASRGDPSRSAVIRLTTLVRDPQVFLPLVVR